MAKRTIDDIDVRGKRVLMRVDFNVPLDNGRITDDRRITSARRSIESVIGRGGRLILMSHLGRPTGHGIEPEYRLKPVAEHLRALFPGVMVHFPGDDPSGDASKSAIDAMHDGEIVLLENLRFNAGEKKADAGFAARLASYGDVYCNNAFGTAHRDDASMVAVPEAMVGRPHVAGHLLQRELKYLLDAIHAARPPFIAVLGGAKVSDKLRAIRNLRTHVDHVLIGGAMAYTFLRARGVDVGASLVESDMIDEARSLLADTAGGTLHLPSDHVIAGAIRGDVTTQIVDGAIPDGMLGLDIGPATRAMYGGLLREAKTIVWNGPMGVFEKKAFEAGTRAVAEGIVAATDAGATSIVGGGDSAAAAESFGLAERFSHVSTGGGASLELLEGRSFRSVELLDEA
ncbi:MAG: phosphoglycerate kinase [Phycisphaerales bacterium]|nr:phosphoglycerate kinase [Phycisphaerales bacterium]